MSARRKVLSWFVLTLWPLLDAILCRVYHIRPLKPDGSSLIALEVRRYKGRNKVLADGSEVRAGDKIIEIHLNNHWFREKRELPMKASRSAWEIMRCLEQDLRLLAQQIGNGMFEEVVALHALTLLHTGARRLGFQVEGVASNLWSKGARFYMAGLMDVYNLRPEKPSKKRKPLELKEIWLSRGALIKKYGSERP